jgi:glycosyltransferase involved in cell wall biosynthesis
MPSLRLVTVTHFFPAHGGGIELVAGSLTHWLARKDTQICWFASDSDSPPALLRNVVFRPVRSCNLFEQATHLPYPLWSPAVFRPMWRAIGQADIVHVHEHLYFGSLVAVLLARLRRRPVIVTQHVGALPFRIGLLTHLYSFATRMIGAVVLGTATRAVFISENVRGFFGRQRHPSAVSIFNGIDTDLFRIDGASRSDTREALAVATDQQVALFVGRFVKKKGLHVVEQLARAFPHVLWVLVGAGPEKPDVWQCSNVRVLGHIDHEKLPSYYNAADILIVPSTGEGFPLVVQEALACGLGVLTTSEVATACPAATDMIRTCPVVPRTPPAAAWTSTLTEIMADSTYLTARQQRSNRARALWSWERCGSEYLQLFNEVLSVTRSEQR